MKFASNIYRTALHNGRPLPDGPLTKRQRALADAVHGCSALSDFAAAPAEAVTAITVCTIRLGTPDDVAARQVREGIAAARRRLDNIEATYAAYGAEAFSPHAEPVDARGLIGGTRHSIVVQLLQKLTAQSLRLVCAGDHPVTTDASGAYVVE